MLGEHPAHFTGEASFGRSGRTPRFEPQLWQVYAIVMAVLISEPSLAEPSRTRAWVDGDVLPGLGIEASYSSPGAPPSFGRLTHRKARW